MKEFIIGIDQGTSGTFVCIMNSEGRIIERTYAEHRQFYPHEGWVEQDPIELWGNACDLLNHVIDDSGIIA